MSCHKLVLRAARSVLKVVKISDSPLLASILSDKSNLGTPKNSSPKLPWRPMSPPVTPRPQQVNQPWSPTSSCWLSHSGPTPTELITAPPSTRRQWTGSTPSRPRYSPYVRQPQLSRPSSIPGVSRFVSPLMKELDQRCQHFEPIYAIDIISSLLLTLLVIFILSSYSICMYHVTDIDAIDILFSFC